MGLHSTRAVCSTLPSSSCSSLVHAHGGRFSVPSPTRNTNCSLSRAHLKPLESAAGTNHTGCKLPEDQFFVSCLCVPSLAHSWVVSGQFCGFYHVSGAPLAWYSRWGNLGKLRRELREVKLPRITAIISHVQDFESHVLTMRLQKKPMESSLNSVKNPVNGQIGISKL